jgi:hypothetical protein
VKHLKHRIKLKRKPWGSKQGILTKKIKKTGTLGQDQFVNEN